MQLCRFTGYHVDGRIVRKQVHSVESWMAYYWELRSKNAQNIKALMCPLYYLMTNTWTVRSRMPVDAEAEAPLPLKLQPRGCRCCGPTGQWVHTHFGDVTVPFKIKFVFLFCCWLHSEEAFYFCIVFYCQRCTANSPPEILSPIRTCCFDHFTVKN